MTSAEVNSKLSQDGQPQPIPQLNKADELATLIAAEPERFGTTDSTIVQLSVHALKQLFDFSVKAESSAVPSITAFIDSISPQTETRATRSSGKRKRGHNAPSKPNQTLFEPTPLDELVIDGMDAQQLWEQIDLKVNKVSALMDKFFVPESAQYDDEDDEEDKQDQTPSKNRRSAVEYDEDYSSNGEQEEDFEDEEQDESEEENVKLKDLSDADLRALGIDPSLRHLLTFEDEQDEQDSEAYAGTSDISDADPNEIIYEPLMTEKEQMRRKEEQEMGMLPRLRSQVQSDDEQDDDQDEEQVEEDEDEDEDEEADQDQKISSRRKKSILDSLDEPGSSSASRAAHKKRHPTLDDQFFSIDEFNRTTEEQEITDQFRDDDQDDEDLSNEINYFRQIDDGLDMDAIQGEDDESMGADAKGSSGLYYADFFLPPAKAKKFNKKAQNGKRKEQEQNEVMKDVEGTEEDEEDDHDDGEGNPEEPERKRTIRFNDTVAIRRIKARKKANELTPAMLHRLGVEKDQVMNDMEEDSEEIDDDEMDEDEDEDEEEEEEDEELSDEDGEDEDDEEDEDQDSESMDDDQDGSIDLAEEQTRTARRVAGDLFADSDNEEEAGDASQLSTHEKRLVVLQDEIAQLEKENVGKKDWTLMGEAGSRVRPQDSLLAEDLEFERTAKVTPQLTEEMTSTIEDLIRTRILDNHFNDVIRKREFEALPFLPSRLLELSDSKSAKGLAELYEEEYQAARGKAEGEGAPVAEMDTKLEKEHNEIANLCEELFSKLDALSNAHFTPKAPKATIQTLTNVSTISIETALPSLASSSSMLAPEEVYERSRHSVALQGAKSEMTPEENQRLHSTLRKEKRKRNDRIDATRKALELSGAVRAKKVDEKKEKAEALKKLVGNKGVSVVGKDGRQKKGKEALGLKPSKRSSSNLEKPTASGTKFKL